MSTKICAKLIAFLVILLVSGGVGLAQVAEPDDVASGATDLGTIGAEGGMITYQTSLQYPGDIDWFKFVVEAPTADLIVSSDTTEDLRLVIYDENLSYLDSGEELLSMTAEAGTYLVRVDSVDLEASNYSIALSNLFESEPNDCISEGNDLGTLTDMAMIGGSIEPMADTDFFLFEVEPESVGYVTITSHTYDMAEDYEDYQDEDDYFDLFDYYSDSVPLVLYGYNESEGRYIPMDHSDYGIEADLKAGRYAIRAESESLDPIAVYVLSIAFLGLEFECEDEPNDSPGEALNLGALTEEGELTKAGCIRPGDDVDYYVFEVNETQEVEIETSGDSEGDSYLYLYDEEMEEIDYDDDGGEGSWSKIGQELEPGTYYIEVEPFWGGAFQYTLTVTGSAV
ncbi:MAG TPA: hypothetical protein HA349_03020 [Methanotrichaceae archaeon]|nr:hypothetical protein [Methanotrichaceae archaeon]